MNCIYRCDILLDYFFFLIFEGVGVVIIRVYVYYIVTEFGIVYFFGKNLR